MTAVVCNRRKRVYELTTILGKRIAATANHPLRTLNGWKLLGDLKPGDRIFARQLNVRRGRRWPEHEIAALGYLLSEGKTCHPTCLYFYNNDRLLIDDFVAVAEQFPDSVAQSTTAAKATEWKSASAPARTCDSVRGSALERRRQAVARRSPPAPRSLRHVPLGRKAGIIGKRATEKEMPAEIFALHNKDLELLLGRLWSGDGSLGKPGQMPYYATSSRQLALDVQTLLLRLGIVSRLRTTQFGYKYKGRESKRPGYTVHLVGADSIRAFLDRVVPQVIGRAEQIAQLRAVPFADYARFDQQRHRSGRGSPMG